jgi:hypothetical protein
LISFGVFEQPKQDGYQLCLLWPWQLFRKAHIGNDIVVVVFTEGGSTPFDPSCLVAQFPHVFIVVTLEEETPEKLYRHVVLRNTRTNAILRTSCFPLAKRSSAV